MRRVWLVLLVLVLLPAGALGAANLYTFAPESPPGGLWELGFAIPAEETTITVTFAGDCTLGGEPELAARRTGFVSTVAREGYAYPFSGLERLFATDDVTLINLEGVLSASDANRADKRFTFIGSPAYTRILTLGSVEAAGLANNHSMDFGLRGYNDTRQALEEAGVAWVSGDEVLLVEKDGYRIGITASGFGFDAAAQQRLAEQAAALRQQNCLTLVHVMHTGQEYAHRHNQTQQATAEAAIGLGASLVVGHHPHVAQDAALTGGVPVFYSLGNCCFGGNLNPTVREGLVLQAAFHFREDCFTGVDWTLYPIRITGGETGNDYCPQLLTGPEGRQVVERLAGQTGLSPEPYTEETGAWRPLLPAP